MIKHGMSQIGSFSSSEREAGMALPRRILSKELVDLFKEGGLTKGELFFALVQCFEMEPAQAIENALGERLTLEFAQWATGRNFSAGISLGAEGGPDRPSKQAITALHRWMKHSRE